MVWGLKQEGSLYLLYKTLYNRVFGYGLFSVRVDVCVRFMVGVT